METCYEYDIPAIIEEVKRRERRETTVAQVGNTLPSGDHYMCNSCTRLFINRDDKYCRECGKSIKWD